MQRRSKRSISSRSAVSSGSEMETDGEVTPIVKQQSKRMCCEEDDAGSDRGMEGVAEATTKAGEYNTGSVTDRVRDLKEWLRRMNEAVSRDEGGKVKLSRGDQIVVKNGVVAVQNGLLGLVVEIMELREKLSGLTGSAAEEQQRKRVEKTNSESEEEWTEARRRPRKQRSYAMAAAKTKEGSGKSEKIKGRVVVPGAEGWKTPPHKNVREVVVRSECEKDARRLAEVLAKSLTVKEMGGTPQGVYKRKDGSVAIVPRDEAQAVRIEREVKRVNGTYEVSRSKILDPMCVVTGVEAGLTEEVFRERLVRQNGEKVEGLTCEGIRVVRRVKCQNPWKENWVIQLAGPVFKRLVRLRTIEWDCSILYVEEYLGLAMCFRCCRFGHTTKMCKHDEVCCECGGGHDSRSCTRRGNERKCVNCWRMYGKRTDHSARDPSCPAFCTALERSRRARNYNG